jgi:uncharacterized protein (TIGR00369 family)
MDSGELESTGWSTLEVKGFSAVTGPFWTRLEGTQRRIGLIVDPHHTNDHLGTIHGGVVMTFADVALGCAVVDVLGAPNCVTAQLNIQFLATAKLGEFVTCNPEVVRQSRQLIFVRGLIRVGDKNIASVDGIWKVLESKPSG